LPATYCPDNRFIGAVKETRGGRIEQGCPQGAGAGAGIRQPRRRPWEPAQGGCTGAYVNQILKWKRTRPLYLPATYCPDNRFIGEVKETRGGRIEQGCPQGAGAGVRQPRRRPWEPAQGGCTQALAPRTTCDSRITAPK